MSTETTWPEPEIKAGDIVERWTADNGTKWVRQWIRETPGMLHLVWTTEKEPTP